LPATYKLALLKNEYGDVAVDSQLASSRAISGVQELLNGCICCNLVGQLSDALDQLSSEVQPDRVVIETSGSAFPATLAMEVNRLSRETGKYVLDGVMSVIDVENWKGYEDTSYTAKIQARYTDLIVLNKWELVDERRLEDVEDRVLDIDVDPPIPRQKSSKGWVDKNIVFGLDARLAKMADGTDNTAPAHHDHNHNHSSEVEVLSISLTAPSSGASIDTSKLATLLSSPTKDEVYRIKGILYASSPPASSDKDITPSAPAGRARYILNWAFGRWTFTAVPDTENGEEELPLRLTVVTARYEANKWKKQIETSGLIVLEDGEGVLSVERKS
jgi:G3E family GTPase